MDALLTKQGSKEMIGIMRTVKEFGRMVQSEVYPYVDLIRLERAELIDESDANYDILQMNSAT